MHRSRRRHEQIDPSVSDIVRRLFAPSSRPCAPGPRSATANATAISRTVRVAKALPYSVFSTRSRTPDTVVSASRSVMVPPRYLSHTALAHLKRKTDDRRTSESGFRIASTHSARVRFEIEGIPTRRVCAQCSRRIPRDCGRPAQAKRFGACVSAVTLTHATTVRSDARSACRDVGSCVQTC